jgi:predicted regulator of Ras-like GTPase activity (Roadblock/LC7/MglB family)
MFRDALRTVVENTEGGMAGLLMDFEGIPVDSYTRDGAPFDIDQVGAEFSVVVKSIRRAAESLEAGATHEVAILADRVMTVIRVVNHDYFLALAMDPSGNVGKARYLLRTTAPAILRELE